MIFHNRLTEYRNSDHTAFRWSCLLYSKQTQKRTHRNPPTAKFEINSQCHFLAERSSLHMYRESVS